MSYAEIKNLSFRYTADAKQVLENINIDVTEGEFLCILGQSGCGKSTLLRLIGGYEKPTTGSISFAGKKVEGPGLDRSMVFQDYGLFPWMSAGDNIVLALRQKYPKMSKKELRKIAEDMLEKVGLSASVYSKLPKELSGGMKQRCAIAQSLSVNPPVLLMDEPFGALDAVTRMRLQNLLIDLRDQAEVNKTVFFVTHDVDEAILLSDRIIVLGQSPSHVILDHRMSRDKRVTRSNQFEDTDIIMLRNSLIKTINEDVERSGSISGEECE